VWRSGATSAVRPENAPYVERDGGQADGQCMQTPRITVTSVAALAMAAVSLSPAAPALAGPQHAVERINFAPRGLLRHVALHKSVKAAGTYEVTVKVFSRAGADDLVNLKIGDVVRHTTTAGGTHRVTVRQRITLTSRRLTIHASARRAAPTMTVAWRKVKSTPAPAVPVAVAPPIPTLGGTSPVPVAPALPAPLPASAGPLGDPGIWNLSFDDEFNGASLNTSVWNTGWLSSGLTGPINTEEEECYSPAQDVEVGGEFDLIAAATPQSGCLLAGGPSTVSEPYVSGMINTRLKFSYTYGYLQTRVWLPGTIGQGTDWPGVWEVGNPAPANGEVDVVEGLAGQACWHFHDSTGAGYGGCAGVHAGGWHTFGADWEPGSVTWYYDGVKVGVETTNITGDPMYIIADLAADNTYGGPVAPGTMRIDYVRVWQH
jgi:Glycosyl hydrolases family 16